MGPDHHAVLALIVALTGRPMFDILMNPMNLGILPPMDGVHLSLTVY